MELNGIKWDEDDDNAWKYDLILVKEVKSVYYQNKHKICLTSSDSENYRSTFGKLYPISVISAVKEYGIDVVEEARETGCIILNKDKLKND